MAERKVVHVAGNGTFQLVPRDQLRAKTLKKIKSISSRKGIVQPGKDQPPTGWDWSKGRTIKFPTLGNDQYGNCFYVAPCHQSQLWTGMNGAWWPGDRNQIIRRYLEIAGGDNGLDDATIFPEIRRGIVGPDGPHKYIGLMLVDPRDNPTVRMMAWRFGGLMYTCSLLSGWLNKTQPGDLWIAGDGRPDPYAGHAMLLSGMPSEQEFAVETWGIDPNIRLTYGGMLGSDPELIVGVSLEWYDKNGISPAGFHYTADKVFWESLGGERLPESPFPSPGPVPVPPDPNPGPGPSPSPSLWPDLLQLLKDVLAKNWKAVLDDLVKIFGDVFNGPNAVQLLPGFHWMDVVIAIIQLLQDLFKGDRVLASGKLYSLRTMFR